MGVGTRYSVPVPPERVDGRPQWPLTGNTLIAYWISSAPARRCGDAGNLAAKGKIMEPDLTQQRRHAHAFLDRLPADQLSAVCGLLESMLSPLERKLAVVPIDDEPLTPEDLAAIQAGIDSLEKNGGVPMEDVLADFGLTMDDFRRMGETPLREESER